MSDPSPDIIARLNAVLEGRYAIERELGEGGMATVYLADDVRHERKVALKVLKPELAAIVGGERFLSEIKVTANLQHPHILPLFDTGLAGGFLCYVMPYVEGESLREKLDREHQLPVDVAVRIATDTAEALDHAHRQGVVHRDIKPGNILLRDGRPLIADFGIALALTAGGGGRITETGLSLGTPHYMSPEQVTGDQNIGPSTDIYALACVLYEMLVGVPPFEGRTAQAVLGKIIAGEPEPVSAYRKSVPPNVSAAIAKALEVVPADRFTDAQGFAAALQDPGFTYGELQEAGAAVSKKARKPPRRDREASSSGWLLPFASGSVITLGVVALVRMAPGLEGPLCTWYEAAGGDSLAVREVSCDADNVEMQRLVNEFSDTLGRSFVLSGSASMMVVTARIQRQPWDAALELLFTNNALVAEEDERGNISVLAQYEILDREAIEPLLTLAYQIRYRQPFEVADALRPFTSGRGTIAVDSLTGVMTVQDVSRVVNVISELLSELDRPPDP